MKEIFVSKPDDADQDEGEALLRNVRENPDDDTPRLVYADWLQENGAEEFAARIRLEIAEPSEPKAKATPIVFTEPDGNGFCVAAVSRRGFYEKVGPCSWLWFREFYPNIVRHPSFVLREVEIERESGGYYFPEISELTFTAEVAKAKVDLNWFDYPAIDVSIPASEYSDLRAIAVALSKVFWGHCGEDHPVKFTISG